MRRFFDALTRLSIRYRAVTLAIVVVTLITGRIAGAQLKQELLPPIEFPQTFIVATVSGMSSDQVLNIVTTRVENAIKTVPEVVNVNSTTTGAFGAFITAANDFGLNQTRLRNKIQAAIDAVWFPQRVIHPADGQDPKAFASTLLGDLTPDVMLYLGKKNSSLFFQLSPSVWRALKPETAEAILVYLAQQQITDGGQSALERLVEQEVVPQINNVSLVANVDVSGGQALPGEAVSAASSVSTEAPRSLVLQLSPNVWAAIRDRLPDLGELNQATVDALKAKPAPTMPNTVPDLPDSWKMDRFHNASDLLEMGSAVRPMSGVLNNFVDSGMIKGSLGQTDDLTADDITKMIAIDPTMVKAFAGEHLAAMSPEVFAALPADFISGLDGFTRDTLASAAAAEALTGKKVVPDPVDLPSAWRIAPPQILTFSLASIPLGTFSVFSTEEGQVVAATDTPAVTPPAAGGGLTQLLGGIVGTLIGGGNNGGSSDLALGDAWTALAGRPELAGQALKTGDDLIAFSGGTPSKTLNALDKVLQDRYPGYAVRLLDSLNETVVAKLVEKEPDFYTNLNASVLLKFAPAVLKAIPADVVAALDSDTAKQVQDIASGKTPSAAAAIADQYASTIPAADPNAPKLEALWGQVGGFLNVELDSADDFFRFPPQSPYQNTAELFNGIISSPQGASFAPQLFGSFSPEAATYVLKRDPAAFDAVEGASLQLFSAETLAVLPEAAQKRAKEGGTPFRPTDPVTRTNGASSLLVTVYKNADANTVEAWYAVKAIVDKIDASNDNIEVAVAFEQSTFVEESISGVVREGGLGALFAIVVILVFLSGGQWRRSGRLVTGSLMAGIFAVILIALVATQWSSAGGDFNRAIGQVDVLLLILAGLGLISGLIIVLWPGALPYPAWRSTLVIAVSIPLSIFAALAMMRWLPPFINGLLGGAAESSSLIAFVLRLAPTNLTLNIMTLSGLTVAIGRVVDDSIVVLENIFRQVQSGMDKREAIISGTRDVSVAIFAATGVAVVVFLPLGLTGGLIGEFFLPFGLAVTYALIASFIVAITVVPMLAFLFISAADVPHEEETWMEHAYMPILKASQRSNRTRGLVILAALVSMVLGLLLFGGRPTAFIPDFGEPQIAINVSLPAGTKLLDTNVLVEKMEKSLSEMFSADELEAVRSVVGGGGQSIASLLGGGGVTENAANIVVSLKTADTLEQKLPVIRAKAEEVFGKSNVVVSKQTFASGGFSGFEMNLIGPDQAELAKLDPEVIKVLSSVPGLTNVSSNLAQAAAAGATGPVTYIRTNGKPALSYKAELETDDTLGVAKKAIEAVKTQIKLPDDVTVGQGFNSELQSSGFSGVIVAMGIAIVIVVVILVFEFGSPIYWLAVILSISVAPVGAAIALTLANRALGISALIGLLMLLGLAVTNAVVLIDRVGSNRYERGLGLYDAIIEAGGRRVRPIIMTALATIIALIPLAIGLSKGAIIASELGTVVIGGMISSTLLTLIVVPAAYYLATPIHDAFMGLLGRRPSAVAEKKK